MADKDSLDVPVGGTDAALGAAPAGAATDPKKQPSMALEAQYTKDLSFENPRAPQSLAPTDKRPDIRLAVDVQAKPLKENSYEVALHMKVEAKAGDDPMFIVDLVYAGVATLANIEAQALQPVLMIEAPRQLFPFARRIISDAARDGGFPPIMLAPIDFVALYRRGLEQQKAKATEGAAAAAAPAEDKTAKD
jgi:preprotein translocase subunit SecB